MFTKSGKKLVRIPIPQKNDLPPPNGGIKQNNLVNGHISSMLDDLMSRGCTVTPIMPEPTAKEKKCSIPPVSKRKKPAKTGAKPDSLSQTPVAKNCSKSSNDTLRSQHKAEHKNVPKRKGRTISSLHSVADNNQIQNDKLKEKDFTAFKAKDSLIAAQKSTSSTDELLLAEKNKQISNISTRKIINGIEYVPYTPQSNVVKRDRHIQVSEFENIKSLETGVQCDLIDDDSSSESSQSDWINEIMEEYEFIEDNIMYECQICGEVCLSHLSHLKHSMTHEERSLLCFRCGRLFPNTTKLLAHEDTTHSDDNKLKIKKALRCPKLNCLKAFHSKRQLFDHIDQHGHRVTDQRCSKCQRSFASALQLLCHMNRRNCWR